MGKRASVTTTIVFNFRVLVVLAWVGSLAMALAQFLGFVSGALIKRFGCRVTILLGGFLCAVSLGLRNVHIVSHIQCPVWPGL